MVKFGKHIEGFIANENDFLRYVVNYNEIKHLIFESKDSQDHLSTDKEAFDQVWLQAFQEASKDFEETLNSIWEQVFSGISNDTDDGDEDAFLPDETVDLVRGATPDVVLELYTQEQGKANAAEILAKLKSLHAAAVNNTDGLRKLVKKFDKHAPSDAQKLSRKFLPKLFCASFTLGQALLEETMDLIRSMFSYDDEEQPIEQTSTRSDHYDWLRRVAQSMTTDELDHLVSHRGFHLIGDSPEERPLENSLDAYEAAWGSGIHLCECDIALTRDEKLVLAHDADFTRLALDNKMSITRKCVPDLTLKELMTLPLKSGSRPPLLLDVLRSASMIGGKCKLVIEIKPGNTAAASALARLLIRYPELIKSVGMIMSFDLFTMHLLRKEIAHLRDQVVSNGNFNPRMSSTLQRASTVQRMDRFTSMKASMKLSSRDLLALRRTILPSVITEDEEEMKEDFYFPKLMLLTVCNQPKPGKPHNFLRSDDFSSVKSLLVREDGELDGVYLQYEEIFQTSEGLARLKKLSEEFDVGCWQWSGRDPDNYECFKKLVNEGGLTYVNTDLPSTFRDEISL